MSAGEFTIYQVIGGEETMRALVDRFYARVEADTELRALFPEDLEPGKRWQFLFLSQYFGGPRAYEAERGHPRLRMRHNPFPIGPAAQERWLLHMLAALEEVGIEEPALSIMTDYFVRASQAMINQYAPHGAGQG